MTDPLDPLALQLSKTLLDQPATLVTAESCTGGLVAEVCTRIAGSSDWFERGFVTYSNAAKLDCLRVPATTLEQFGAVSEQTAAAMAIGALQHADAQYALAITGIAGPGGGSDEKPVGTVCFGFAGLNQSVQAHTQHFQGDRNSIRHQAAQFALQGMRDFIL